MKRRHTDWLTALVLLAAPAAAPAGQVYALRIDGSEPPTRLTEDDDWAHGSPAWSPDSRRVAFDHWPVEQGLEQRADARIGIVPLEGGPTLRLRPGAMPSWSPDGTQIVYHTYESPQKIAICNADGRGRESLIADAYAPRWLPDGRAIACLGFRDGRLMVFDLSSGKTRRLPGRAVLRPGFDYCDRREHFCGPGIHLYQSGNRTRVLLISDNQGQPLESWRVRHRSSQRIGHATWSPDGKRIVFAEGDILKRCRLYEVEADTGDKPVELPGLPEHWICCNPRWSPDGEWIAFIRMDEDDTQQPEDGSDNREVAEE